MTMIGYCELCEDKIILTEELQSCKCGNLIAQTKEGDPNEPESIGGKAVIVKMDEDKIIALCKVSGLFDDKHTIVIDPTFSAKHYGETFEI